MTTSSDHSHPVVGPAPAGVTASTARSDEDGSTSSARRESSQEPTPPPRLPLTSRPTEILSHMFSHVPYDDYDRLIEQITLNKRYFAVAYPHWMRKLTLDGNDADIVFAAIGMHAASSLIREIDACFLPLLPQTQCAIFRHTPNLTHLTVDLSDDYDDYPLPTCFFAALRTLRHLSTLRFAMTREASQSMTSPSNATSLPFANSTLLPTAVSQPVHLASQSLPILRFLLPSSLPPQYRGRLCITSTSAFSILASPTSSTPSRMCVKTRPFHCAASPSASPTESSTICAAFPRLSRRSELQA